MKAGTGFSELNKMCRMGEAILHILKHLVNPVYYGADANATSVIKTPPCSRRLKSTTVNGS
jgi:hypothetical protein